MKKMVFLLLLIPAAFGLECYSLDTKTIGSAFMNYSVTGEVDLNFNEFTFENFSFTFKGVPQTALQDYATNGMISTDGINNTILFFNQPEITENLKWYFNTSLLVSYSDEKVEKNVEFPYTGVFPDNVKKYLNFTKTANEDLRIKILTNNLLAGVTDYLTAIAIISEFTAYYIDYNLSYFPSSSATATEIYNVKKGVCDEFSTFSISMYRSVGIPARYVSGYVYTNIGGDGCTNFEPHSWTEVYIPDHGWVSVDTTYKEFFWINSAHIPLYKNDDLLDISSIYLQRRGSEGNNFLNKNSYTFNIEIMDYEKTESTLDINVKAPREIGQDSYLLVNVSIINPTNYWVLDTLISTPIKTVELINSNASIPLVVAPMQTMIKYFIFKIPDLGCSTACYSDANFKFSLGGGEYDSRIIKIDSEIESSNNLEELLAIAKEDERLISPDLLVSEIKFNKNKFLEQKPVLSFSVKNIGNSMANINMTIMYGDVLLTETIENLLINEQRNYEKELNLPSEKGLINLSLKFDFQNTSLMHNSSFIVLKSPEYNINVEQLSNFSYSIALDSGDDSLAGTIRATINNKEAISKEIQKNNVIDLNEDDFRQGVNNIRFVLDYSQGDEYYFKTIDVSYNYSLTLMEKITRFFESIINIFKILLSA